MEFDNIETIKRAVEIGIGIAIVPQLTVEVETARGSLKMLEFQEGTFTRPLAIIYKRGRELSPAVRKFIDILTAAHPGTVRADKTERTEKADKAERAERAERPHDSNRHENNRAERAEKSEKSAEKSA